MAKFKNDKGLTLIELLITIAVLAVVSAIALPVINNVVSSSNSNATTQTQSDVTDFIAKYNGAGTTLYANGVFSGYVDTDGDNTIDSNELVDTLTLDAKFSANVSGNSASVGGTYTNDGVTGATVILSTGGATTGGTTTASISFVPSSGAWYAYGSDQTLVLTSYNASTRTAVFTQPKATFGMCMWDFYVYDSAGNFKGFGSGGYGNTFFGVADDGTTCTYTADFNVIEASDSRFSGNPINPATDIFMISAGSYNPIRGFTINL